MNRASALVACAVAIAVCCTGCSLHRRGGGAALADEAIERRIREHRTAEVRLTILREDGTPLAGERVAIRQASHRFLFGCNAMELEPGDSSAEQATYRQRLAELFNQATLGFYWAAYEPEADRPYEGHRRGQVAWLREHGFSVTGHPLVWRQEAPQWLPRDVGATRRLLGRRIDRDVTAFAGDVDAWDVVNEAADWREEAALHDNPLTDLFLEIGAIALARDAFATSRAADDDAALVLNDFRTDELYEELIREALAAGVDIDAVGIQLHMHRGYRGAEAVWDTVQRFSRLGKPLRFSEITVLSGKTRDEPDWTRTYTDWHTTPKGEVRQARQVVELYRLLFSHPAVEAITWWDLRDPGWLGAPAGLLRRDGSPKPAYEALMKLIKGNWWTVEERTTDAEGRVSLRGFLGVYEVHAGAAAGRFELKRGAVDIRLTLSPR